MTEYRVNQHSDYTVMVHRADCRRLSRARGLRPPFEAASLDEAREDECDRLDSLGVPFSFFAVAMCKWCLKLDATRPASSPFPEWKGGDASD